MCRYAYNIYKLHYVCFGCRKQFKRPLLQDVLRHQGTSGVLRLLRGPISAGAVQAAESRTGNSVAELVAAYEAQIPVCPQCGAAMENLGRDFKPPRTSAVRAWEQIEAIHRRGHYWGSCGCDGAGFIPTTRRELRTYLEMRR